MHYTRVYYWVSSWWANRIGLASLIDENPDSAYDTFLSILSLTSLINKCLPLKNEKLRIRANG